MDLLEFVDKYSNGKGLVKGGTLCFYGHWFGRPYDNYHQIVMAKYDKESNSLIMIFNEKEILTIKNPILIEEKGKSLEIKSADKILWQWYYYGKPPVKENLYFIEIIRNDKIVSGNSNVDWYKPSFKDLTVDKPAILLVGF